MNKVTKEIRDFARQALENPDYRARMMRRLIAGKAPQLEIALDHYAYGKPKESVEHSGDLPLPPQVIIELHRSEHEK